MVQKTLFNDISSFQNIVKPITLKIEFIITTDKKKNKDTVCWGGKAFPHISSGGDFGGITDYEGRHTITEIVHNKKLWFEDLGRPIIEKINIIDNRVNQKKF